MTIPEQADIVKRLRDWEDYEPAKMFGGEILKDTKEAADEIERLRSLVGVERAPPPLRAREEIAALRELYEWYDRDGSVGAAADVFEKHRALLAQRIEHEPFTPLRAREEIAPDAVARSIIADSLAVTDDARGRVICDQKLLCKNIAAALSALSRTAGQEWRDISSAKKDGTHYWGIDAAGFQFCMHWKPQLGPADDKEGWFGTPPDHYRRRPTHWMPLPAPPVAEKQTP
jgi:hypothetical protein